MSLQQQQNFLARLYTDAEFRRAFLSAPEKIGAENSLDKKEITEIAEILPEELNFFADSLFWKRLREVEKLLPLTKMILQNDFEVLFRAFSTTYNPQNVKKHLEDSFEFCNFIQKNSLIRVAKSVAKFERARLIFNTEQKKIIFEHFDFDMKAILNDISKNPDQLNLVLNKKKTFVIWLRIGKNRKQFIW
ncbi:MAG: hypothetical protein ABJA66_05935 [Actinomycetota bacterium]